MSDRIVSIVIPSYNSAPTLSLTLRSVLRQLGDHVREVIVVDSSDDGALNGLAQEYGSQGVRFITSGVRVIAATQRNIGARSSAGELLLFLDADVILEPDYVDKIVGAYRSGCRAGFGSVKMASFQRTRLLPLAQYYAQLSEYLPSGNRRRKELILGCSSFCERRLFDLSGGFPEMLASEDVVYGRNLARLTPIWFIPEAVVAHVFRDALRPFFRHETLLGTYVARYRSDGSRPLWSRGALPLLLAPLFFWVKALRVVSRTLASGPIHVLRLLLIFPILLLGLAFWTGGFVKGARSGVSK